MHFKTESQRRAESPAQDSQSRQHFGQGRHSATSYHKLTTVRILTVAYIAVFLFSQLDIQGWQKLAPFMLLSVAIQDMNSSYFSTLPLPAFQGFFPFILLPHCNKMAVAAPGLISIFKGGRKRGERFKISVPFIQKSLNYALPPPHTHTRRILFVSYQSELCHMAAPCFKGSQESLSRLLGNKGEEKKVGIVC